MGFIDIDDEKDNIEDLERDEEIILERLHDIKRKSEWIADMMDEVTAQASQLKLKIDLIQEQKHKLRKNNNNSNKKTK